MGTNNTKAFVYCKLEVEGFHCWPDAFKEVSFLRNSHRHIFHIKCLKEVDDHNREVEFIILKRKVIKFMVETWGNPCQFDSMSCEHIAQTLLDHFALSECEVSEDGENGAVVRL